MSVFVTGGAGFIGSNRVLDWLDQCDEPVINLDALTYAGSLENPARLQGDARQCGEHLGEDDIVRFQDHYGRA